MFDFAPLVLKNVLFYLPQRQRRGYPDFVAFLRNKRAHGLPYMIGILFLIPDPCRATMPGVVPKPVSMVEGQGAFLLTPDTAIDADAASQETARRLKQALTPATGLDFA